MYKYVAQLDPANPLKGKRLHNVSRKLGNILLHIRKTIKRLQYSISSHAICKLKWGADLSDRSDQMLKSILLFDGKTQSWD